MPRLPRIGLLIGMLFAACAITAQAADPPKRAPIVNRSIESPGASAPTRESLLQLLEQIEELQSQLRQLQNQVEVQNNELERLKSRQRDLMGDLDRRLRDVERRTVGGAAAEEPAPATAGPSTNPPASMAKAPTAEEQRAYDDTLALLKQGAYDRAIREFGAFLVKYPDSGLADHVHYWMGEAYYVQRNHKAALGEFTKVVNGYRDSQKLPDALFRLGALHQEMGAREQARRTWTELVEHYPGTTQAKAANKRLQELDKGNKQELDKVNKKAR